MTVRSTPATRRSSALALVLALAMSVMLGVPLARAQDAGDTVRTLTDAEFRWGINKQSSGPSHGPGHNFLSAGDISTALSGPNQQIDSSDWRARSGSATIEKRSSSGSTSTATWEGTTTDQSGAAFARSSTKYSGLEMVFTKGTGEVDAAAGTAEIEWDGTVSVVYYSGLVYMTISDPVLKVEGPRAVVTATMGGHRSDRENTSEWVRLNPTEVVLAEMSLTGDSLSDEKGFSAEPEYLAVSYEARNGDDPQSRSGNEWGAFPKSFVDFASDAGGGSFWYSSGGSSDAKKVPLPLTVSWDAEDPAEASDPGGSGGSKGLIGQVVDDTVEDILRAAGTDVADTAAAWMDEAWKPLQPDAVKAAPSEGAAAQTVAGAEEAVVDETFEEFYEEYYTATSAMTAGTVGGTVAAIPAPTSAGSSVGAAAPVSAPAPLSEQATMPAAANLPLTDVVYAQTSASQQAGSPVAQWQWWVGAALLVLAAVLFSQTVRRKD